jgi:transposase
MCEGRLAMIHKNKIDDSSLYTVGLDLAKNVFQVHEADGAGRVVLRKKLRRTEVLVFFSQNI